MTRYYSDKTIQILEQDRADLRWRTLQLQQRFLQYQFNNERAKEFGVYGFSRRLLTLVRCIENTFAAIPHDLDVIPATDQTQDVAIQVQAFIFNVFGCLDNLAWMWVLERNITLPDGIPLPPKSVGLRTKFVKGTFDPELRRYLDSMSLWFEYLENYRHALAHRIPLYVPPFYIIPKNAARHNELERAIFALTTQGKTAEAQALKLERDSLRLFQPRIWMGGARPIDFHPQVPRT
jgi:hypothetical protein